MKLTSFLVIAVTTEDVYLRLPKELHEPVELGCDCSTCKEDRSKEPMWDCIVISRATGTNHIVHFPEGAVLEARDRWHLQKRLVA